MRYLAIDLGERRTGLAVGDVETGVVTPLETLALPDGPDLVRAVTGAIADQDPDAIVLGLPVNMDGSEGPAARRAREFAGRLAEHTEQTIYFQDERLTSFAADQAMAGSGRTHKQKKELRDALAAAQILRDFLGREKGEGKGDSPLFQ